MFAWIAACSASPPPSDSTDTGTIPTTTACAGNDVDGTYYWEPADACVSEAEWDPSIRSTFSEYVAATAPDDGLAWNDRQGFPRQYLVARCPAQDGVSYDVVHESTTGTDDGSWRWAAFDPDTHEMVGSGAGYWSYWYPDQYACCDGTWASERIYGAPLELDCSEPDYYWPEDFGR